MEVPISNIPLWKRARDREFDGPRIIAGKEADSIRRTPIELGKCILIKTPRHFDELVMVFVSKHNVEGQKERSGILTTDQGREFGKFHGHTPLFSLSNLHKFRPKQFLWRLWKNDMVEIELVDDPALNVRRIMQASKVGD